MQHSQSILQIEPTMHSLCVDHDSLQMGIIVYEITIVSPSARVYVRGTQERQDALHLEYINEKILR